MNIIGQLNKIKIKPFGILILFILASIEPPFLLPFSFPKTTWGIMKLGLLVFMVFELAKLWIGNHKDYWHQKKEIFFPIFFYLLACLISFYFSVDIKASLEFFLFLGIGLAFFFLGLKFFFETQNVKNFFWSIVFLSLFSGFLGIIIIGLFRYAGFSSLRVFFVSLFPWDGFGRFLGDLDRGRVQTFWHLELGFPILIYFYFFSKKNKILAVVTLILSFLGIMLANNRYQFVTLVFGLVFFILLNKKYLFLNCQKQLVTLLKTVVFLSVLGILLSNLFLKKNLFDRFLLKDYSRDVKTLESRINLFNQVGKLFLSSPFFGVGPKNFSFYMTPETESKDDPLWKLSRIETYFHLEPHNLWFQTLAEMGGVGFLSVVVLFVWFLRQDIFLLKKAATFEQRALYSALILAFWSYFIDEQFTFINDSLAAVVFFWFVRGILAALYLTKKKEKLTKPLAREKVMLVTGKWVVLGGVEKEIQNLAKELAKNHLVSIYVLLPKRHWHPKVFLALWFNLIKIRPKIIFSYGEYSNLICGFSLLFYPFGVRWFAVEMNNPRQMLLDQKYQLVKKKLTAFFYNYSTEKVIAVSLKVKELLVSDFSVLKNKIWVINSGVDIKQIKLMAQNKSQVLFNLSKMNYLVAVGRLSSEKRFDYLIEVFNKVSLKNKNLKLLIVGEGVEREKLVKLIKKLKLTSKVLLIGNKQNPFSYIKQAKMLVLTSSSEGLPHVIIEAMALGTLVIATKYEGVEELINQNKNGIIVSQNDQDELVDQILKFSKDDQARKKMTTKAQNKIAIYDQELILKKYQELL